MAVADPVPLSFEGFTLDPAARSLVDARGENIQLRRSEFELLLAFANKPGRALSRNYLLEVVAGRQSEPFDRSIDVLVGRLRRKIEREPGHPKLILTVPGIGYRFAVRPYPVPLPTEEKDEARSPTLPQRLSRAPERRQLTIMHCALTGSTFLSAQRDLEDLQQLLAAFHEKCREIITRAGGTLARMLADGILVYFGYPQGQEHQAESAVRGALSLIDATGKIGTGRRGALQLRVGIATGLVVVGDLLSATSAEPTALGAVPSIAAGLLMRAEPGTVMICATTRRLVGELFRCRECEPAMLTGCAEPVPAWQVIGEGSAEGRFEALRTTATPLVGRDEELALLQRRWQQAKGHEGCIVLVSGEPGIGKSRLAHTLLERLSNDPHTRVRLFCSPYHRDSALHPTITQLERAAGFRRDDTAGERLDKLEAVLGQTINDPGEAAPLLAALLSLPAGERYPPLNLTPQRQKEKTLRALVAQVEGLALQQPLVILFEDAQWSDPTSLELLDLIIDRVPTLPLVLIITFRPEFTPPWTGRPQVSLVSLCRLPPRQRAEMIAGVTGGKALPREVADQIIDRTDGVPLFVEELTKAVVESGMVTDAGDHYTAAGPLPPVAIPETLQASLLARLDRLAPVRDVVQIGAALGRQFSHELIAAVAVPGSGPGMSQRQLDDGLAQLVGAELIYRRGTPPDAEYTFKHALVQDAAYSTLLRSRRQQLHAQIAAALEDRFPEIVAGQPALLAHHCEGARLMEKAVDYWLAAGRQAWGRSMLAEAVVVFRRGLGLIPDLPDTDWRREREFDLQIALARALMAGRSPSARETGDAYNQARQLALALNRPRALLVALYGQWVHQVNCADLNRARQLVTEMKDLGKDSGDVAARMLSHQASNYTGMMLGEFTVARENVEQGLPLFDPADRLFYAEALAYDPLVALLAISAPSLASLGYLDQAVSRRDTALAEARRLSHPHTLAIALTHAFLTRWIVRCEVNSLLQYADELLALSVEHGLGLYRSMVLVHRGWCLAALGDADQGIRLLTSGLAGLRDGGYMVNTPWVLTLLADACRKAGQLPAALVHLAEAQRLAEETGVKRFHVETLRLQGDVLLATGDPAAAEISYVEALALAQRQSAKLWELCAAMSLARLWRKQSKHAQARDLLAQVYNWFTEGFDTPVLQEAKTLLEELAL
jgi:class 3 adenylate cyclase/tetratricopeptide (TPR) repeat protein